MMRRKGYIVPNAANLFKAYDDASAPTYRAGEHWVSNGAWLARKSAFVGDLQPPEGATVRALENHEAEAVVAKWAGGKRLVFEPMLALVGGPGWTYRALRSEDAGVTIFVDEAYYSGLAMELLYGTQFSGGGWLLADASTRRDLSAMLRDCRLGGSWLDEAAADLLRVEPALRDHRRASKGAPLGTNNDKEDDCA